MAVVEKTELPLGVAHEMTELDARENPKELPLGGHDDRSELEARRAHRIRLGKDGRKEEAMQELQYMCNLFPSPEIKYDFLQPSSPHSTSPYPR